MQRIDIMSLLDELVNEKEAREVPVSISVYVDETAPADLAAHVRNVFASSRPQVRMTVSYLTDTFIPHPTDDAAVIVAGRGELAGKSAAALRAVGVPPMVVTVDPKTVERDAIAAAATIPDGDIVSPFKDDEGVFEVFDDQVAAALDARMARWMVAVCRDKKLALAISFPFMRREIAMDSVQLTAFENAGVGLVPFPSGADLPIMTVNQVKMVLQIAAVYGKEIDKNRIKEIAVVVGGAFLSRSLARKLIAAVPVLGFLFRTGVAYGTTLAMGYAVIEYFEGGEDVTGVANVVERAAEVGTKYVAVIQEKAAEVVPQLTGNAEPAA